jgi:hypothetical protein
MSKLEEAQQIQADAVALGGARGGHARAAKLSPERRSEIARTAAAARWGNVVPIASPTTSKHPVSRHPLIVGLIQAMPQEGAEWSFEDRDKWLKAAAAIFDLVYTEPVISAGETP